VLLKVDFPRERAGSSITRAQNQKLKAKYSVAKVPTLVFLDPAGQPFARAGYDDVRLRDEEHKGDPKAAIAYLESVLTTRPGAQSIVRQPSLGEALAYAKKHYAMVLLMISQGHYPKIDEAREALLKDQQFVKFVNRNLQFVQIEWPVDSDVSKEAELFRSFVGRHKIEPAPLQLVVWELPDKVDARVTAFSPDHVDKLIHTIQNQLPKIDYSGGWVDDLEKAKTIAAQQERFIFIAFTSMDHGDWSRKMDEEIFQTSGFKSYARKKLVPVRLDFPTASTQPATLAAQNRTLAELYNVRGFPTIILLNPLGQKVADAKYMHGGPGPFLAELDRVIRNDADRRAALKE